MPWRETTRWRRGRAGELLGLGNAAKNFRSAGLGAEKTWGGNRVLEERLNWEQKSAHDRNIRGESREEDTQRGRTRRFFQEQEERGLSAAKGREAHSEGGKHAKTQLEVLVKKRTKGHP